MAFELVETKPLKKYIKINIPATEESDNIVVKVKFFKVEDKVKVRFCKKQGDITAWYNIFSKMIGTVQSPNSTFLIPAETPVMNNA